MSIFSFFKRKPRPVLTQTALSNAVRQLPQAHGCKIRFADSAYGAVEVAEAFKFARDSTTYYAPEVNDCDDAAFLFKAAAIKAAFREQFPLACGMAWMPSHAVAFCVTASGYVYVFDGTKVMEPMELPEQVNLILL